MSKSKHDQQQVGPAPSYYWDACMFLSLINGIPGRVDAIRGMLDDCKKGDCKIWTSTVSMVEVAYAERERTGRALNQEVEETIDLLWAPPSRIQVADVSPAVAVEARGLIRTTTQVQGWGLKPCDAIHLATAKRLGIRLFHTYDSKLPRFSETLKMKIGPPEAGGRLAIGAAAPA